MSVCNPVQVYHEVVSFKNQHDFRSVYIIKDCHPPPDFTGSVVASCLIIPHTELRALFFSSDVYGTAEPLRLECFGYWGP